MKTFDRIIGIYDSAEMKLNTATTFWVPVGMTTGQAYAAVKKTDEYKKLNKKCGGTDTERGDVGMAVWNLPFEVHETSELGGRRL